MDFENQSERAVMSKILSRRSSVGCSSRLSYYRSGGGEGGVPFKWEKQPGVAKEKSPEEVIPPLTPPPALVSLGLPKPCIHYEPNKHTKLMRLRFWKKGGRRIMMRSKKAQQECCNNSEGGCCCYDEDVGFLNNNVDYSSDSESTMMTSSSPRGSVLSYSSFSSCSCSSSSSSRERVIYGRPFNLGCFPNVRVMVSIARRE
ncbi:uncharacterized protein LOC130946795 [Arachis stenosperma]|uniref:uncharacterized protein LOC130946795 n=1 Tax=Arachis stenosperma TaxID=217475 RepID=UPI0025AC9C8D|nr:uncharacterized protein LOC130946795 [Arachis stenosperma]